MDKNNASDDEQEDNKPKEREFGVIYPKSTGKRKEKLEKENFLKQQQEEAMNQKLLKQQREEQERKRREKFEQDRQQNFDKIKSQVEDGEGNLNEIFSTILRNTSPYELSFPNFALDNDSWDFSLLMTILEKNTSLLTLSLSRKNLRDEDARRISEMLMKNHKLRRLELEGNFFGPKGCEHLAAALKVNTTLRYLDLENNNLTDSGKNTEGIKILCEALKSNKILISLNLSNNYLMESAGDCWIDMWRTNHIVINWEYFHNKEFFDRPSSELSKFESKGLYITKIKEIKTLLKRNNEEYTKMRTDEWIERKKMTNNFQDNYDTMLLIESKKEDEDIKKKEKDHIEVLYLNNFEAHVKEMEAKFNVEINKYYEETKARMSKKKKRKGKKKK